MTRKTSVVFSFVLTAVLIGFALFTSHTVQQQVVVPASPSPTLSLPTAVTEKQVLGASTSEASPSGQVSTAKCTTTQINPQDAQAFLADPSCTPGVIDTAVTQENIHSTICVSGYTTTKRPPTSYTNKLKLTQIAEYGYTDTNPQNYEEDHLISLELGGAPSDPKNLWPEPHASYNEKDKVENYLHKEVCSGRLSLSEAQQEISGNWYAVYLQL